MIVHVFRSPKKAEMYLYLLEKDGFSELDEQLQRTFGEPEFVMVINLSKRSKLARADINKVKEELTDKGYYLQMPPKPELLVVNANEI